MTNTTFDKSIRYDRATGDFAAYLDDNYIGHFATYHDAEVALDQVAYDLLMDGQCATAAATSSAIASASLPPSSSAAVSATPSASWS